MNLKDVPFTIKEVCTSLINDKIRSWLYTKTSSYLAGILGNNHPTIKRQKSLLAYIDCVSQEECQELHAVPTHQELIASVTSLAPPTASSKGQMVDISTDFATNLLTMQWTRQNPFSFVPLLK